MAGSPITKLKENINGELDFEDDDLMMGANEYAKRRPKVRRNFNLSSQF